MKYSKFAILLIALGSMMIFSSLPFAYSQVGVYTFHGAAGNEKILRVRTVNNQSLEDLFGVNWVDVIETFGSGAADVGAMKKSLVTDVNFSAIYNTVFWGVYPITLYNTSNWDWTTEPFNATPDSTGDLVRSFYDPTNLTHFINALYTTYPGIPYNISMHTAGALLAQLPTPVSQYLGALVYEPKWESIDNTVRHNAEAGDTALYTVGGFTYYEDCTEIWTYDTTYGAWIGYKILDNETNTIYEFSIELPAIAEIPGFELITFAGVTLAGIIGLIYVARKKK
jgi:hypothetical protein